MKKDQKSKAGEHGDSKGKLPYMTLVEVLVEGTTAEDDDHELGRAWCVGRTYCSCPVGLGLCEHKGTGLQVQSLYWDEDRPEERPTHFYMKNWGKYGRKRKAAVLAPLDELPLGRADSDATQFRQCRDSTAKLDYDVADKGLMRRCLKPSRMAAYCELRRRKNSQKEPEREEAIGMSDSSDDESESGNEG